MRGMQVRAALTMGYKEARRTLGVTERLFAALVSRGVLPAVEPPDGGPRLYPRSRVESLAALVAGVRYGKRRVLLGEGRRQGAEITKS